MVPGRYPGRVLGYGDGGPGPSSQRTASSILRHVNSKSPRRDVRTGVASAPMESAFEPLPDEVLDALVVVLDEIRHGTSRSRSELVARTGLGRAIVARRVQELLDRGLVTEGELGPSTGGRPPRHLAFRAAAGQVLVADIGATSIAVALTDLAGRIVAHYTEPADVADGPEAILGRVEALFAQLRETSHRGSAPVWGVGIAVPGPVEFATGRPISPPIMPGRDGHPLRAR